VPVIFATMTLVVKKGFARSNRLKHGYLLLLVLVWAGMQAVCWHYYQGPRLIGDGKNYLACARILVDTDKLVTGHYRQYAGYIAFIAFFLKLGLGLRTIALAQVALSGLAALAFYNTACQLSKQHWPSATAITFIWISWLSVQANNPFILTESVFTSCLVLCLWALVSLRGIRSLALLLLLLLLTTTIRPNGFVVLAGADVAGLRYLWYQKKRVWAFFGILLSLGAGVLTINQFIKPYHILTELATGTILFGYEPSRIKAPATIVPPEAAGWPVLQLVIFIKHNFTYFCQLCTVKIFYFLGYPRPWYSGLHRVWAMTVLPIVYALAALGLVRGRAVAPIRLYLATAIVLQIGIIALTVEDWDSRFSAPFMAYWLQLAVLGLYPLLQSWISVD